MIPPRAPSVIFESLARLSQGLWCPPGVSTATQLANPNDLELDPKKPIDIGELTGYYEGIPDRIDRQNPTLPHNDT
jgi:hypothetical protein